jgi:hypothetical protein
MEQTGNALRCRNAGIEEESRIDLLSLSESASRVTSLPDASFGATWLSMTATHWSPMPEKLVRIAGAPTTMPSK